MVVINSNDEDSRCTECGCDNVVDVDAELLLLGSVGRHVCMQRGRQT